MDGTSTVPFPTAIFLTPKPRSRLVNVRAREPRSAPAVAAGYDAELLAILAAPLAPGDTALAGYARKEAELGNAIARLAVLEARALHARLSTPRAGDVLAAALARLTSERRHRLLAFLAGARRREAIAAARR